MKKMLLFFKRPQFVFVVLFTIATPFVSNAKESAQDGLQRCGLINDTSARLACYDHLGERKNATGAETTEQLVLPTNDLNAVSLSGQDDQQAGPESITVKVMKCIKKGNNKYDFYLESGQVWKQTSDKRLYLKDCNFDASIHKDFFGYKILLEDGKKKIRVKRVR